MANCVECSKEFKPNRYWQKFCSRDCYKKARVKEMQDLREIRRQRKLEQIEKPA